MGIKIWDTEFINQHSFIGNWKVENGKWKMGNEIGIEKSDITNWKSSVKCQTIRD